MDEENKENELNGKSIQVLREEAIKIISELYPADSQYYGISEIGRKLLEQAEKEMRCLQEWKDKPTVVLMRYAQLCKEYAEAKR